jgi:hypothetical protein
VAASENQSLAGSIRPIEISALPLNSQVTVAFGGLISSSFVPFEQMSELPRNSSSDLRDDRTGDTPGVTGALIALLLIYLILLIACAQYSVIGSDSSGYANLARSLLNGQIKVPVREIKVFEVDERFSHVFTPLGYTNELKDGRLTAIMLPFYPIGLPLHEAWVS